MTQSIQRDIGHDDVYRHDFWNYPWPEALVKRLAKEVMKIENLIEFEQP